MGEEVENADSGGASSQAIDPAAIAVALGGASRETADAFLKKQEALIEKQGRLVDLQAKELAHELKLRHWSLWVRHASGVLKLTLEVSLALIGVGIACLIGVVVWNASRSNALVFDSFSVPPDIAAKGVTGEVLAGDLMDRVTAISRRFPQVIGLSNQSYTDNFNSGLKLEIPETGISLDELDNFLRTKLGHDTHVSGALVHTASGLRLSVRTGDLGSDSIASGENDLDALTQRVAEAIYGRTQPIRYGVYLYDMGRYAESRTVLEALTRSQSQLEQADGYRWLSQVPDQPLADIFRLQMKAAALDPKDWAGEDYGSEIELGRYEPALADIKNAMDRPTNTGDNNFFAGRMSLISMVRQADIDDLFGAYHDAAEKYTTVLQSNQYLPQNAYATLASRQALDHDLANARSSLATSLPLAPGRVMLANLSVVRTKIQISYMSGDWAGVLSGAEKEEALLAKFPSWHMTYHLTVEPIVAAAEARLGRFAAAEARVRDMPGDCYPCLIAHAQIGQLEGQSVRADYWFSRAVHDAPSIPFAYNDWGQVLLERGQADAAIAKFKLSNQKGPHFADPLEGWGEALMAKNRSDLALAKFEEADKYAPNWGRLHLKWGEALSYVGKKDDAARQLTRAASLDLTPSEKAELAGMNHG